MIYFHLHYPNRNLIKIFQRYLIQGAAQGLISIARYTAPISPPRLRLGAFEMAQPTKGSIVMFKIP